MTRVINTLPPWLIRHLTETGRWDTDSITRKAKAGLCRHCGQPVIRGLDNDRIAGAATTDPTPIDTLGEALALLAGHSTYDLTWRGHYELDHRNQWSIQTHPPSPSRCVVADHHCNHPTPPSNHHTADPRPPDTHPQGGNANEPQY